MGETFDKKYTCATCDVYMMPSNIANGECPFGHKVIEEVENRYWTSSKCGDEIIFATEARAIEHNTWVRNNSEQARECDIREWHLDKVLGRQSYQAQEGGE